ncbi:MAG: sulfurtransferase TusA family protein [Candidatus Latescibacter sp.]|nr:sulfurtransferase TusA family protein [Candidatus Latescibacter sp.]
MKTDYSLDTVGRFCPVPIIETANKIKEMNAGETLTIISDDPGIKNDMTNWCSLTGNEYLEISEEGDEIRVYVRKKSR